MKVDGRCSFSIGWFLGSKCSFSRVYPQKCFSRQENGAQLFILYQLASFKKFEVFEVISIPDGYVFLNYTWSSFYICYVSSRVHLSPNHSLKRTI